MKEIRKSLLLIMIGPLLVATSLQLSAQPGESPTYESDFLKGVELLAESYQRLLEEYAIELDPIELAEAGVLGMVRSLDIYTAYVSPEENRLLPTHRPIVSLGLELYPLADGLLVVGLAPNGPAEREGVRIGDRILEIDGEESGGLDGNEALSRVIGGVVGDKVRLDVQRSRTSITFNLTRESLTARLMEPMIRFDDSILYARIDRFDDGLGALFRSELLRVGRYEGREKPIIGILLDLRGNSGGIVDEAVDVADLLLPTGSPIGELQSRRSEELERYRSKNPEPLPGVPVVVLVDRQTASAAEIVAVAIQENRRGLILGERTLGKGVAQQTESLRNGGHLRITTSWSLTPTGRSIDQGWTPGLPPDSIEADGGVEPDSLVNDGGLRMLSELREEHLPLRFASRYTGEVDDLGMVDAFIAFALKLDRRLLATHAGLDSLRSLSGSSLVESDAWGILSKDLDQRRGREYEQHRDLLLRELRETYRDMDRGYEERQDARLNNDDVLSRGRELLRGMER